jgi:DNA-directed RNA polymerase specialized sigma24 family protein
MSKHTKIQKVRVIQSGKDSSRGEQSAYWDDVETNRGNKEQGDAREHLQANPDALPETEIAAPSTPQLLMGEAIEHLQGRQREVYILLMRENKSQEETAEILGIGRTAVQSYKNRAVKFITQYCKNAMAKGRV